MKGKDLDAISKWQKECERGRQKRVLGVVGPCGVGKTTLVENVRSSSNVKVGAFFSFKFNDPEASTARACFASIAEQLGLDNPKLEEIQDTRTLFRAMLGNPLQLQQKEGTKIVVLDAMDEAENREELMEMLLELWEKEMPVQYALLFTCRPVFDLQGIEVHKMAFDSKANQVAISNFLRSSFSALGLVGNDLNSAVSLVEEKSDGFFVYAAMFVDALRHQDSVTLYDVSELVATSSELCDTVYKRYFARLLQKGFQGNQDAYQLVLSVAAALRAPLHPAVFAEVLESQASALHVAKEVLAESQGGFSIPHATMESFLLDKKRAGTELYVPEKIGHERLAHHMLKDMTSLVAQYDLTYHLCKIKAWDKVRELMLDFKWVSALISENAVQQNVYSLDELYNYRSEVTDKDVLDVVRALNVLPEEVDTLPVSYGKELEWDSAEMDAGWFAFQLVGRIANQSNPIVMECRRFLAENKLLCPTTSCLEYNHPALRKVLKEPEWCIAFAIVGDAIVTASSNGLSVWEKLSGACVRTMKGCRGKVSSMVVSGNMLVAGLEDRTLRIWDWRTGVCLRVLKGHRDKVFAVAAEGSILVSGSADNSLRVWDGRVGTCLQVLEEVDDSEKYRYVRGLEVVGDIVIFSGYAPCIQVWDWRKKERLRLLDGHSKTVKSLALQGDILVSGSDDGTVRVWNWGEGVCSHVLEGHCGSVSRVVIVEDVIVSSATNSTVRVWNAQTGACLEVLPGQGSATCPLAFDGELVVCGVGCKTAVLQVGSGREVEQVEDNDSLIALAFSSNGEKLLSGSEKGRVKITDTRTGECTCVFENPKSKVWCVSFAGSGHAAAAAAFTNESVRVWETSSGNVLREFTLRNSTNTESNATSMSASTDPGCHSGKVTCIAMDGVGLVTAAYDKTVRQWDIQQGKCIRVFQVGVCAGAVAIGNGLVAFETNSTVRVLDRSTGDCLHEFESLYNNNLVVAGDVVLACNRDGVIRRWDGSALTVVEPKVPQRAVSLAVWNRTIWCAYCYHSIRESSDDSSLHVVATFDQRIACIAVHEIDGVIHMAVALLNEPHPVILTK